MAAAALDAVRDLPGPRSLVALAGPPGAGKSTVGALLVDGLNAAGRKAAGLPMDGFHLDNRILERRGLLPRKGAAETFDAEGFVHLIARAAAGGPLIYPLFDRSRDIAIAGAGELEADTEIVVVEGNYLLHDMPPWSGLAAHWARTIWIDAEDGLLRARLVDRWLAEGLPRPEAEARADGNDMPNARAIRARRRTPDLELIASG